MSVCMLRFRVDLVNSNDQYVCGASTSLHRARFSTECGCRCTALSTLPPTPTQSPTQHPLMVAMINSQLLEIWHKCNSDCVRFTQSTVLGPSTTLDSGHHEDVHPLQSQASVVYSLWSTGVPVWHVSLCLHLAGVCTAASPVAVYAFASQPGRCKLLNLPGLLHRML